MVSITAQDFNNRLKNSGEIAAFKDLYFTFDFSITKENCKSKRLSFENCEFNQIFTIENVELNYGLIFKNCVFHKWLVIQGVEISQHYRESGHDYNNNSFLLSNCKIEQTLFMISNVFLRDANIEGSTIYEVSISKLTSREGGLTLKQSTVEYYVSLEQCHFSDSIRFSEVNCKNSLRFTNNNALSYLFTNNTFESDSWIWYGKLKEGIAVSGGNYKDAFIVESVDAKGAFTITDAIFESSVSVAYESKNGNNLLRYGCSKIYLSDSEFKHGLYISGKRFSTGNFAIDGVDIRLSKKLKGEINIAGLEISELKITGTN